MIFICPICNKTGKTRQAILMHFRQALGGWDPLWDKSAPHSKWARECGLKVPENGYCFDNEGIKRVLYEYFDSSNN